MVSFTCIKKYGPEIREANAILGNQRDFDEWDFHFEQHTEFVCSYWNWTRALDALDEAFVTREFL